MDTEQCVKREISKNDKIRYLMWNIFLWAFGLLGVIGLIRLFLGDWLIGGIQTLLCGGMTLGAFKFRNSVFVEFDYAVVDDTLLVAKVYNYSRRKELLSLPIEKIERIFPAEADAPAKKVINAYLNQESKIYAALFRDKNGEECALLWEPNEKILRACREKNPRAVKL